jgi:hypothetical protein
MPISTQVLRNSLAVAASVARTWFEERSRIKTRDQFMSRGALGDVGSGAVYAYFTAEGKAVYVGQTGRAVKARLHDQTSPHKKKEWWKIWQYMRFVSMPDGADRLVLEALLIAGYEPTANEKPSAKSISDLFSLEGDSA